jgi:D-sedoheptulose 7-phosphate isomerase
LPPPFPPPSDDAAAECAAVFRQVSSHMALVGSGPYVQAVGRAVDVLHEAFSAGRKLLVFGNGGSAADAEHLTAELVGRFTVDRAPLAALALTTNQALLTAWSNDHAFEDVFARQIEALGAPGDVALGISTSGSSANVLNGLRRARERGLRTIGLCGESGGRMAEACDILMAAPLAGTARIQEVHLVTYHAICAALERRLFAR